MEIKPISAEQTWPIRHAVMWPNHPIDFVKLARDQTDGRHFGLYVAGELVSILSVFIDGESAQFRKFATLETAQGKGYGSFLLHQLIESILPPYKVKRLWCNARQEKSAYYERFGLKKTDTTYMKGGIGFVVMEVLFDLT